jgi:hypothetical protein
LAGDIDRASTAIDAARAVARRQVWRRAGSEAPDRNVDHRRPLIVDVDMTSSQLNCEPVNPKSPPKCST